MPIRTADPGPFFLGVISATSNPAAVAAARARGIAARVRTNKAISSGLIPSATAFLINFADGLQLPHRQYRKAESRARAVEDGDGPFPLLLSAIDVSQETGQEPVSFLTI